MASLVKELLEPDSLLNPVETDLERQLHSSFNVNMIVMIDLSVFKTEVSSFQVRIDEFHCIQKCTHFRVLE